MDTRTLSITDEVARLEEIARDHEGCQCGEVMATLLVNFGPAGRVAKLVKQDMGVLEMLMIVLRHYHDANAQISGGTPSAEYTPETPFQSTNDGGMVYSLKQDGWNKGKPRMVNDVWITVNAPAEHRAEITRTIMRELNGWYKPNAEAESSPAPCSAVEAFRIARKTAEALLDQCRYMRSINEEPSELAEEALQECVRAGYLPNAAITGTSPVDGEEREVQNAD